MTPRTTPLAKAGFLVAMVGLAAVLLVSCGGHADTQQTTISVRYSQFSQEVIQVRAGQPVTFELRNDDPILHEWIVGTEAMHDGHRSGTEPHHDEVPTEVSLPAYETRFTTVRFETPGDYAFICHLPGHEAYGMKGTVRVVES